VSQLDSEPIANTRRKWWRLSEREKGNLGLVALYFGLAANCAQFLAGEIRQWWQLALICTILVLMIIAAVIIVKPKRSVPISISLAAVLIAGALGVGGGYFLRDKDAATGRAVPIGTSQPAAPDSPEPEARLEVDQISANAVSSKDITVTGRLVGELEPGSTLWMVVSKATPPDVNDEPHYLQPGPCVFHSDGKWTCKHVRVGGRGAWKFTALLVDSEMTNSFVERRLAGQRKDLGSGDADRRNFVGSPEGALLRQVVESPVA